MSVGRLSSAGALPAETGITLSSDSCRSRPGFKAETEAQDVEPGPDLYTTSLILATQIHLGVDPGALQLPNFATSSLVD